MTQFLWAVVGAFFSLLLYVGYERVLLLRRPKGFFADWHSSWQPTFALDLHWVTERLKIGKRFGRVVLESRENSEGYEWRGTARILDDRFIVGEWKSVKPGSQASGAFVLVMGLEGQYMIGLFLGPEAPGLKVASGFVLGRKPDDIDTAKNRLVALFPSG
jgi:hypothetical protein